MNTYKTDIFSLVAWHCYDGVTLKHGAPHWGTPLAFLLVDPQKIQPKQTTVKELKSEIHGSKGRKLS